MIKQIYKKLLKAYGPQGWWPLFETGYHPGNYDLPLTRNQVFEVCVGAVLTQNTAWKNVEKALLNLKKINALSPQKIMQLNDRALGDAVKPAGYFNQKSRKLREFTKFFLGLKNKKPERKELLDIWGIGPETADSILLYAYKIPSFVVDAYTKRIMVKLGLVPEKAGYDEIKALFEKNLKPDFKVFQEYHALLVEHAKRFYAKKKEQECFLYEEFVRQ